MVCGATRSRPALAARWCPSLGQHRLAAVRTAGSRRAQIIRRVQQGKSAARPGAAAFPYVPRFGSTAGCAGAPGAQRPTPARRRRRTDGPAPEGGDCREDFQPSNTRLASSRFAIGGLNRIALRRRTQRAVTSSGSLCKFPAGRPATSSPASMARPKIRVPGPPDARRRSPSPSRKQRHRRGGRAADPVRAGRESRAAAIRDRRRRPAVRRRGAPWCFGRTRRDSTPIRSRCIDQHGSCTGSDSKRYGSRKMEHDTVRDAT